MHGSRPGRARLLAGCLPLAALLGVGSPACAPPPPSGSTPAAPADGAQTADAQTADAQTADAQTADATAVAEQVRALLSAQVDAWNRGDIEGFMEGYWRSPELRFVSGGEVTYGWQETLERYRRTYPDRAAMGTLSFEEIDVRALGPGWAAAHGRYVLERAQDRPTGLFTLLVERRPEGWRVVHDHTSSGS
jgi:uncharacterized protein (TIGR02246 family)